MSSEEFVIRVNGLSKCYHIYDHPQDRLKQSTLPRLRRLLRRPPKQYYREFWALKDVTFEAKRGESVGIIGRNGSGKSTLLQLICGTLTPTTGTVETSGRIAALLELGSGFNPEFSGRENVYMNANILGLSREQVDERFDDIAAFADIGKFIDQPVKIYSSGMSVRLAFSVIAHVDADILVVDEALAVGDAVFSQKCMRFIRAFQERGTLLFVSHDAASVLNLCRTGIWLGEGHVRKIGASKEVAEAYLQYTLQEIYGTSATLNPLSPTAEPPPAEPEQPLEVIPQTIDYGSVTKVQDNTANSKGWKTGRAEVVSVRLEKVSGQADGIFLGGEDVRLVIHARAIEALHEPIIGFLWRDHLGQDLFGENTLPFTDRSPQPMEEGQEFTGEFEFKLPMLPNGQYAVMATVADGDLYNHVQHHWLNDSLIVTVASSKIRWGLVGIPFERVALERVVLNMSND